MTGTHGPQHRYEEVMPGGAVPHWISEAGWWCHKTDESSTFVVALMLMNTTNRDRKGVST